MTELESLISQHAELIGLVEGILRSYVKGNEKLEGLLEQRLFEISLQMVLQKSQISLSE